MTTKDGLDFEAIAVSICREWKTFWMNQTQHSKEDHENYLRRAMGVDANMRGHLEDKISKALKEAYESGAKVVLPERKLEITLDTYPPLEPHYAQGFNEALDEIKRLNPHLFGEGK